MPTPIRRLLNLLPLPQGGGDLYVRPTWHKPTPFDPWPAQPPYRPMNTLRADHFVRCLRRRRLRRALVLGGIVALATWIAVESVRALVLL